MSPSNDGYTATHWFNGERRGNCRHCGFPESHGLHYISLSDEEVKMMDRALMSSSTFLYDIKV